MFLVFKINAFELVAVFCGIVVRIPSIGSQWFNIQSGDLRSEWKGHFPALYKLD